MIFAPFSVSYLMGKQLNMGKLYFYVLGMTLLLLGANSHGQEFKYENCGTDTSAMLNECEVRFLNHFYTEEMLKKKAHEFSGKRFAFISADRIITKKDFFDLTAHYRGPKGFDFFTKEQKALTGYDGVVMINRKAYNLDQIAKLIRTSNQY